MLVFHHDFGDASGTAGALSDLDWDSSQRMSISAVYPCSASFLSRETALIDFPHSRQTRLARGVISPQNGHILCNRTSWICGLSLDSNSRRDSRTEASRRRREGRYCSINFTFAGLPLIGVNLRQCNDDRG
jgi:hypothetical protein